MASPTNLIDTNALIQAVSTDFVEMFGKDIKFFTETLGITRVIEVAHDEPIKRYTMAVTRPSTTAGEGEEIPLTKVAKTATTPITVQMEKERMAVSAEAISKYGFEAAVGETSDELLTTLKKDIRGRFYNYLADGTGTATGETFQMALARAWGEVQTVFEDDAVETYAFAHPSDVADHLGGANITVQTVFGMQYVTGFIGVTGVFVTSLIPEGKIYVTAGKNIVLAKLDPTKNDLASTFNLTTTAEGFVGVSFEKQLENATYQMLALYGLTLFAENLGGVIVATIEEPMV